MKNVAKGVEWLAEERGPQLTKAEVKARWQRLCTEDFSGKPILLANRGGDQYSLTAKIVSVERDSSRWRVVIHIQGAILFWHFEDPDADPGNVPREPCEASKILIPLDFEPPIFHGSEVLLPSGGIAVNENEESEYGDLLDIGFIN